MNIKNSYCVYLHKNKINNKVYVGQTKQSPPERRWGNNGIGYSKQTYFYNAIQKYGWDNFEHIILKENLTLEEADYWENYYINFYHSNDNKYGYNNRTGGHSFLMNENVKKKISQANKGKVCSEETKKKISKANLGKSGWNKGCSLSKEHRQNISKSNKGKKFSQKHKENLSKSHSSLEYIEQLRKSLGKKVLCIETGMIFNSYSEAAEWCGLKTGSSIGDYLRGKQKSAGKHPITKEKLHWKNI